MIREFLAFFAPGPLELLVIIVVAGIPVVLVVVFLLLILRNKKENIRLRLEVGKLADELEQERKRAKRAGQGNAPAESG
jgi:hypothetical protein